MENIWKNVKKVAYYLKKEQKEPTIRNTRSNVKRESTEMAGKMSVKIIGVLNNLLCL
jgi:hypothetical protein